MRLINTVAYIAEDGTGYLQHDFAAQCPNCNLVLNKEALSVVKFARDLVLDPYDAHDKLVYGNGVFMAYVLVLMSE